MITIISGTDRSDSLTLLVAKHYEAALTQRSTEKTALLNLEDLPQALYGPEMYKKETLHPDFVAIEDQFMIPADKLLFVVPEYNGSYPGIVKLFIDACSIRSKMAIFKGKKAALVGVATGRAGNIRGLEHLSSVLMFMGVTVMPQLLPLSTFHKFLDTEKQISDDNTLKAINKHIDDFINF